MARGGGRLTIHDLLAVGPTCRIPGNQVVASCKAGLRALATTTSKPPGWDCLVQVGTDDWMSGEVVELSFF